MRYVFLLLVTIVAILVLCARNEGAGPPCPRNEPLQGAIVFESVLTTTKDCESGSVYVWRVPVGKDNPIRQTAAIALSPSLPERWCVGHGGVWVGNAVSFFGSDKMSKQSWEWLDRSDLGELLKGRAVVHPRDKQT